MNESTNTKPVSDEELIGVLTAIFPSFKFASLSDTSIYCITAVFFVFFIFTLFRIWTV